jgi:hypothetical protein
MELAVVLALAASFCTAMSSVCQRLVAAIGAWALSGSDLIKDRG